MSAGGCGAGGRCRVDDLDHGALHLIAEGRRDRLTAFAGCCDGILCRRSDRSTPPKDRQRRLERPAVEDFQGHRRELNRHAIGAERAVQRIRRLRSHRPVARSW
jgi:hypothetical protein